MQQKKITAGDAIRQGHLNGRHYFVFVVKGLEHNMGIEKVLTYLKEDVLPYVEDGYKYESVTWSNRFDGYLVQVQKPMNFNP